MWEFQHQWKSVFRVIFINLKIHTRMYNINIHIYSWKNDLRKTPICISGLRHHAIIVVIPSYHCQNYKCKHNIRLIPLSKNCAKISGHDQNLISSEGGQDTSACQISGHSFHAVSRKSPEAQYLTYFTKSKWHQNDENQQTMTKISTVLMWLRYIS